MGRVLRRIQAGAIRLRLLRPTEPAASPRVGYGTQLSERNMKKTVIAVAAAAVLAGTAAYGKVLPSVPESVTVTDYYKQNVYDPADKKIGEIKDVLIASDGKVAAFIIEVGGFIGAGAKDV